MKITLEQGGDSVAYSILTIEYLDLKVVRIFPETLTKQETANRLQSMAAALRGDVKELNEDET